METVITRDTDILREYIAALDARERGMSPFARLMATVKLARLRRELNASQIEAADDDLLALRREIDERTERSFMRRFEARPWGARLVIFLMLVIGQQLALALIALLAAAFVRLAPVPKRWNPVLPHEDPGYLLVFSFFFFFVTPMLALLVVFGGRFFRSWRKTLPAVLLTIVISAVATYLVFRNTEAKNPVRHLTSLEEMTKAREVNVPSYRQWVAANWLMSDPQFQRDYESYLRNGPGRWIVARIYPEGDVSQDAAWRSPDPKDQMQSPAMQAMSEYLDGGQDPNGFRDWLRYYLDRHRIYSEDRIEQEVTAITGPANQRFLGLWQVEPYLKERDQRLYRAYLGEVGRKLRLCALGTLALYGFAFLVVLLTGPALSFWERMAGSGRGKRSVRSYESEPAVGTPSRPRRRYESFPERGEITTPPFFDTPLILLSRVHRGFMRLAIFTILFVFACWAVMYAMQLSSNRPNPATQVGLMRSFLVFGSKAESEVNPTNGVASATYATIYRAGLNAPAGDALAARVAGVESEIDESDYQNAHRFKEQYKVLAATQTDVSSLKSTTAQLQQATTGLPQQISQVGSQAEARAGQAAGDAAAARQMAQSVEQQLSAKLKELEGRAARASEEVGRVEAQASGIGTRTEKLETDIIGLTKQLEARTDELSNRTAKEREDQAARIAALQNVAFAGLVGELTASVDEMERRVSSNLYRFFNKGEAQREADTLRQRITSLATALGGFTSDQAKQAVTQLEQLRSRLDEIAGRIK
ncbi:MAG TPA: hypothetical protein VJ464_04580 [Blastocatellia bacterium]|nr:hypothetical protein [Blastocatellia bacterium]